MAFPHHKQPDQMDCGPTCLRIISTYYGKNYSLATLRQLSSTTREGSSLLGLSIAAEKIGLKTLGIKISFENFLKDTSLPCIAHWNQSHYIVIYKIEDNKIYVSDPAYDLAVFSKKEFLENWTTDGIDEGVLLLLEPSPSFYDSNELDKLHSTKKSFAIVYGHLRRYKKLIIQLIIALSAGSLLQLIFPFLTQSIIDVGIQNHDINFIYMILLSQLMVFIGRTTIDVFRSYIVMFIGNRVNIALVSDFFTKLMKLPISYFDVKMTGDILQRIQDHKRVETFLTVSSLSTLFSMVNLILFSLILAWYNLQIFLVFAIGSVLYFLWVVFFLKKRADIDYKLFQQMAQNQGNEMELINGMQEIKLNNAENQKRHQWEDLQIRLFKINVNSLSLSQTQNSGSSLINELKNIIITFLSVKLVFEGHITIGVMLSISYIIGQLNSPILDIVNFVQRWQDAKLSLERINEIHEKEDEESDENIKEINISSSLKLKNLSFKYNNLQKDYVLKNLNITIPSDRITAIVGASGSGKTTLMKILLRFYEIESGDIEIGSQSLKNISPQSWRAKCGVVMQDGYIFSDTIRGNIAVGVSKIDEKLLLHSVTVANIRDYIESLPLGYNTKIGMEGTGLSAGQKQRILIARAVYKNPKILFLDEATSALDSNNEKIIIDNLNDFFKKKTVIVIAHRLSTVKNADQILVLDKGKIVEAGNHLELIEKRGTYYELVKNQLELEK